MNITTSIGTNNTNLSNSEITEASMLNHNHTVDLPFTYGLYAMPDYTNMIQFGSRVYKINVPGYIFIHFGIFANIDYALVCSSSSGYLTNINGNTDKVFKLCEGFGHFDRNQSSSFIPIVPGKYTYIRPTVDLSYLAFGQQYNMRWFFIPAIAIGKQFSSYSSKFIVDQSGQDLSINYKINNNLYGLNDYRATIFQGANDPDTWKKNIGYPT